MAEYQLATMGGGCFWGVEYHLQKLDGVISTEAGYCGGTIENPTYKDVKTGTTGAAEVVQIKFDPLKISFDTILDYFWRLHDPTQLNKQGPDFGTQYRSVIFYHDESQRVVAEESKKKFDDSKVFPAPVVTEISPYEYYFKAEDYHQDYFNKNGGRVCHVLREK